MDEGKQKKIYQTEMAFTINEASVNMISFYSVSQKKYYQKREIKKYQLVIKLTK